MKRTELEVEHHFKNRFVAKHRLKAQDQCYIIGTVKEAQIRLVGEQVGGVHAAIECTNDQWRVYDMGSETGTWVKKTPIVETEITDEVVATIGHHTLKMRPVSIEVDLFSDRVDNLSGGKPYHEIVVKKRGLVMDVHLVDWGKSIKLVVDQRKHELACPTNDQPVITRFGSVVITQQKVHSRVVEQTASQKMNYVIEPEMRRSLAFVLASTLLIFVLMTFWPQAPEEVPNFTDVKMLNNKFTKVIFDAKQSRQRKQASEQARQVLKKEVKVAGQVNTQAPKTQNAANTSGQKTSVQLDKALRASGLGQLIGKIAKRRAPTGVFVQGHGAQAGTRATGMANASIDGTITDASKAGIAKGTGSFKLGGASTSGRAGGQHGYLGSAGLGGAGVGSGSVGVLEEESEIQGGLAREIIARVIADNIGHIRYCYERQLSANPELYGKVLVKFTIGPAGSVDAQSIGSSTLNNANVEGCILRRVSGWKFPKPTGGTSVLVSYPFLFKSTN